MEGWHLKTCFHDPMHVLYLGTCKDLYASALGYWLRNNLYGGPGALTDKLRRVSFELKKECKDNANLAVDVHVFVLMVCANIIYIYIDYRVEIKAKPAQTTSPGSSSLSKPLLRPTHTSTRQTNTRSLDLCSKLPL